MTARAPIKCRHSFCYVGVEFIETKKEESDCYIFVCYDCGCQRATRKKDNYEVIE